MSKKILENNRLFSQQPLLSEDDGNLLADGIIPLN